MGRELHLVRAGRYYYLVDYNTTVMAPRKAVKISGETASELRRKLGIRPIKGRVERGVLTYYIRVYRIDLASGKAKWAKKRVSIEVASR